MNGRLLSIQYAGDYREAVRRFANGGEETYYAQRYSVESVANLTTLMDQVAVLCCLTEEPYNELLSTGVRAIGAGFTEDVQAQEVIRLIELYNPTHLLIGTPMRELLRWAIQHPVKTLVSLADSFNPQGLRDRIRNYQLASLLNHKNIDWVGNHGINASRSLAKIGVNPDKIIPWDWPHAITPDLFSPKLFSAEPPIQEIIYVGAVMESKGISDVLNAVSYLKTQDMAVRLKVIGKGDIEGYRQFAKALHIDDVVEFLGLVPNTTIIPAMRAADAVIIPSRHAYPEGLPMTIYEALCSRTPIIASDHPMFVDKLIDQVNALIFPAGDSVALAGCIQTLLSTPKLYGALSLASLEAWKNLQIPVKGPDLVKDWLSDSEASRQWLFDHRLASNHYQPVIPVR